MGRWRTQHKRGTHRFRPPLPAVLHPHHPRYGAYLLARQAWWRRRTSHRHRHREQRVVVPHRRPHQRCAQGSRCPVQRPQRHQRATGPRAAQVDLRGSPGIPVQSSLVSAIGAAVVDIHMFIVVRRYTDNDDLIDEQTSDRDGVAADLNKGVDTSLINK